MVLVVVEKVAIAHLKQARMALIIRVVEVAEGGLLVLVIPLEVTVAPASSL